MVEQEAGGTSLKGRGVWPNWLTFLIEEDKLIKTRISGAGVGGGGEDMGSEDLWQLQMSEH